MQRFTCDETGLETYRVPGMHRWNLLQLHIIITHSLLPSCAISVVPAFSPPVQEKTWKTNAIQAIPADSQILLANHVLMKDLQNTQPCPYPSRPCRPCFSDTRSCCKDTWNNKLTNHNISCVFLYHIKTSPGSFPWPIIKCRWKIPKTRSLACCFFCFFSLFPQIFSCLDQGFGDPHWQMVLEVFGHKFAQNAKIHLWWNRSWDIPGSRYAPLESTAAAYNYNSYSLWPSCAVSFVPAFSPPVQEKTWKTNAIQAIPADSQILLANHG